MKKILSIWVVMVLLVSGGLLSFNQAQAKDTKKYSGEELYKGILFAQGDVAKELPSIWDKETIKMSNNKKGLAFTNEIVKSINKNNPKYFKELEQAVYSGNQLTIERSLIRGAKYFGDFVEKKKLAQSTTAKATSNAEAKGAVAGLVAVVYAAGAVTTAGVVTHVVVATAGGAAVAYLAITTTKYLWNGKKSTSDSFNSEVAINEIANTFSK